MEIQEILDDLYNHILCDFTDRKSCEAWKNAKMENQTEQPHAERPFFSYMMCVYNDTSLLNAAINSLLKQSFPKWELIILDNSDKNDAAWEMIENAMYADDRIHGIRGKENVGWAKGASICLSYVKGVYTSFLAADDCINLGALDYMYGICEKEAPDIMYVGIGATEYSEGKAAVTGGRIPPRRTWVPGNNRSHVIAEIMRDTYYNSFCHYMNISFLRQHNIDFFEPYYSDCGGMTEAMVHAKKMIAVDYVVYFLTRNTSQTAGWWIWDATFFRTAVQWRSIKNVFLRESFDVESDIQYIAERIINNEITSMRSLCLGRCRNKYMNKIDVSGTEILAQLEAILSCDEIMEMMAISAGMFPKLLESLEAIADAEYVMYMEEIEESWLAPLLKLALYGESIDPRGQLDLMSSWLMCDKNKRCVGFEFFCALLKQGGRDIIEEYGEKYKYIAERYKRLI